MAPRVAEGDWFFVDPDEPAAPGRLVGVADPDTGERTCRLLAEEDGRWVLRAVDARWPSRVLDGDLVTMITGTVVFVGSGV